MKKYIILILALAIGSTMSFAQKGAHGKKHDGEHKEHHKKNPELRKELKAFQKSAIDPLMEKEQADFDAQLSGADLAFIQNKRIEAQEMRKAMRVKMKEMHAKRKAFKEAKDKNPDLEHNKEAFQKMREDKKADKDKMRAFNESLAPFIERNNASIKTALEKLKTEKDALQPQMDAILQKHGVDPEEAQAFKKNRHYGKKRGDREGHGKRRGHHHDKDGDKEAKKEMTEEERKEMRAERKFNRGASKFILWNKNDKEAGFRELDGDGLMPELQQNYPNPASNLTTIEFDLPEVTNNVSLVLTNMNGKVVKQMDLENLNKGDNRVEIDLDGLSNGTYFYTIKAGKYTETKKMVVAK